MKNLETLSFEEMKKKLLEITGQDFKIRYKGANTQELELFSGLKNMIVGKYQTGKNKIMYIVEYKNYKRKDGFCRVAKSYDHLIRLIRGTYEKYNAK